MAWRPNYSGAFDPATMGVPNRGTNERDLDLWNQAMRRSPLYQNFLRSQGLVDSGRGVTMSRAQQSALEASLGRAGFALPGGMHIDQGGNLNQKNRLVRNLAIGGAATGAALFALPAMAGGAAASAAPVATGGSTAIPAGFSYAPAAASAAGTAGTAGAGAGVMTFGNLMRLGELGAGVGSQLYANRVQGRAMDRDALLRSREFAQQMALVQQQQAEDRRRWDAEQAQRANEYELAMEDRTRRLRLEDEREARRAPYRAMSQQALRRLGDLLRLGRG